MLRILLIVAACMAATLIIRETNAFPDRGHEWAAVLAVWIIGAVTSLAVLVRPNAD